MAELIIISLVALLSFILGHKVTIRSINGQSLFSRTPKGAEIEEEPFSEDQAIFDETWEQKAEHADNGKFKEPEMESKYARDISS